MATAKAKGEWIWVDNPTTVLTRVFDEDVTLIEAQLVAIMESYAPQIESWLKAHGQWQDRTGNLRQSLFARVKEELTQVTILIGYGVEYGDYVEYGFQGRYAVIAPALDYFWPRIFADVRVVIR